MKIYILFLDPAILLMTQELANHMIIHNTKNIHINPVLHNILICIGNTVSLYTKIGFKIKTILANPEFSTRKDETTKKFGINLILT